MVISVVLCAFHWRLLVSCVTLLSGCTVNSAAE